MRSVKLSTVLWSSVCPSDQLLSAAATRRCKTSRRETAPRRPGSRTWRASCRRPSCVWPSSPGSSRPRTPRRVEVETLRQKIAALEKDIADKQELIKSMQDKLMACPPAGEVSTALEDFAKGNDMIEYDASKGIVRFKSDLLFDRGSDDVTARRPRR